MKLILTKKPKNVKIIEGFPGFGLIGTIATEFLIEHLDTEKIGSIEADEVPAMIAVHQNKIVEPISIHYNKKYNIVLVHALNVTPQMSWNLADTIRELAKEVAAKEIISLEGVGSPPHPGESKVYYYSTKANKSLTNIAHPLVEGIVVGVTGALMVREKSIPVTALFAEAESNLPDSKAAAAIIKALDQYAGLEVDYAPLLAQAKDFQQKLKGMMQKGKKAEGTVEKKRMTYVG
mgnify:CR=1 FL=1|tara:strand:- start:2872 stop:3573 length:702 start_codon:yes stop_codon:yes gene_type:complete